MTIYEIKEDGTREEIEDIQETRRLIGPDSYDDDYNLVYYTSELRDMNGRFIAIVDFNADGEGKVKECPHCLQYEIHNKLKPRILKKGEIRPPDYDELFNAMNAVTYFLSMKHTLNQR